MDELRKLLATVDIDSSGQVDYQEFVAAFKIEDKAPKHTTSGSAASWQASVLQQVANVLYQHRIHLRAAFRMFDIDNRFKISQICFHFFANYRTYFSYYQRYYHG